MFTVGNVKQLGFKITLKSAEKLGRSTVIFDSEFQTEGALTLKAFDDKDADSQFIMKFYALIRG